MQRNPRQVPLSGHRDRGVRHPHGDGVARGVRRGHPRALSQQKERGRVRGLRGEDHEDPGRRRQGD
ncbi:hypothetical protein HKI87_14g76110 [Chloropicon roscoffensis]|uniref:Uncharacterized protein n=1 Tax=Chloropicon roscoffensis TaxID=1461544 RepID=A0AAX4PJ10_9CHLO